MAKFVKSNDIDIERMENYVQEVEETRGLDDKALDGKVRRFFLPYSAKLAWAKKVYPGCYFETEEQLHLPDVVRIHVTLRKGDKADTILGTGTAQRYSHQESPAAYERNFVETCETIARSRALNEAGFNLFGTSDEFEDSEQQDSALSKENEDRFRRTTEYAVVTPEKKDAPGAVVKSEKEIQAIPGVVTDQKQDPQPQAKAKTRGKAKSGTGKGKETAGEAETAPETASKKPDETAEPEVKEAKAVVTPEEADKKAEAATEAADEKAEAKEEAAADTEAAAEAQESASKPEAMTPSEAYYHVLSNNAWYGSAAGKELGTACQEDVKFYKNILSLRALPHESLVQQFGDADAMAISVYLAWAKAEADKAARK